MTRKIRSDSLYALCTPEQRDELLVFLVELGGPYSRALKMLEEWGVRASLGSLSRFVSEHGMDWRLKRAAELAANSEGKLPEDWERAKKLALTQKEFELAFRDLTLAEYVALEQLRLDRESAEFKGKLETEKLALNKKKFRRQTCKDFLDWYGDARAREIAEGSGSKAEKIEALGRAMFPDWDE